MNHAERNIGSRGINPQGYSTLMEQSFYQDEVIELRMHKSLAILGNYEWCGVKNENGEIAVRVVVFPGLKKIHEKLFLDMGWKKEKSGLLEVYWHPAASLALEAEFTDNVI